VERGVPITAGGSDLVPIQVTTLGSMFECAVENKHYDIRFEQNENQSLRL
jgi:hypothetical protein